ncbi:MAG TPA: penicillin-binding protein 2 [Candidatus Limnocylindrales bacterium]|nr:penicillin-binding protein 2 [Candidatus Limnocylindrales bacterium]
MSRLQGARPRSRILTLLVVLLGAYLVLFGRLVYWQGFRHADLSQMAAAYHDDQLVLPAVRGKIVDRNGDLLVTNTPVFSIYASPDQIPATDRPAEAARLAQVLSMDPADVLARLGSTKMFVYLKRQVSASVAADLDRLQLAGIGKIAETQRTYVDGAVPGTTLAANLLGFVNASGQGNYGLEGYYDPVLAGRNGFETTVRDLTGRPIVLSDRQRQSPVDGMTLQLGLDSAIQVVAERALQDGLAKYQAESGSVLIMEPKTGRIVAWADAPSYNANQYGQTNTAQFRDPIVADLYEPGSVMKVVTLAGALDVHAITPDYRFNETGVAVVGGYAIHNWDHRAHGMVTMTQVLEQSLNVGAIRAEQLEGGPAFFANMQRFGIGDPTGIDVAGEASAPLGDPTAWKASRLATASFGQGVDVTPIEMLAAVNAIATGGDLVQPHVVDQIIDTQGHARPVHPRIIRRVISPQAAAQMRDMMIGVVEHGSGFAARIDGFRGHIAGKTGTANIPVAGGYGQDPSDVIASFVGFVPAEDPQFTMLVVVHRPKTLYEGAYVAAPIWKTIASALITRWNIAP